MRWDVRELRDACNGAWRCSTPEGDVAVTGVGIDTRTFEHGHAYIAIRGETHDGHAFVDAAAAAGASVIIVEDASAVDEGVPVPVIGVDDTRTALLDLARAYRATLTGTRVVGVTGSAGKTTTCRLIDTVLGSVLRGHAPRRSFNNEIGVPLTILGADPDDEYLVCEIGTNAPGEIDRLGALVRPDIAVITSIGRSHLQGLGSLEGVAREKAGLLAHVPADGVHVLTADTDLLAAAYGDKRNVVLFGRSEHAHVRVTRTWYDDRGMLAFETGDGASWQTGLVGEHNACNAAAAITIARSLGLDDATIREALGRMQPPPMRLSSEQIAGVRVFNDAYNANPESMLAAIRTLADAGAGASRRVGVLGDMLELGDASPDAHVEIARHVVDAGLDAVVLVGPNMRCAAERLAGLTAGPQVLHLPDVDGGGLGQALDVLRKGDCVLVKGSRMMRLERVIDELRRRAGTDGSMEGAAGTLSADG